MAGAEAWAKIAAYMPQLRTTLLLGLLCLGFFACGKPPAAPTPQPTVTPVTPSPPVPPPNIVLTGRLTSTVTGLPIPGASIDLDGQLTTSAADGAFRYEFVPGTYNTVPALTIKAPNILDRNLRLSLPSSRDIVVDAITHGDGFDLSYYRRMVRDDYDSPGLLRTLRRWNQAPRLYVRTIDQEGRPIEASTLNPIVAALQDEATAWTGGRFGLAAVELGTESREGVNGWITVKWVSPLTDASVCGRAQIATNGGWIEFNYLQQTGCACRGSRISPMTARHELGHAMGFYHTGDRSDVLWSNSVCDDRRPSARERLHAAVAYGRSFGNADPDIEPTTTIRRNEPPVIIVD